MAILFNLCSLFLFFLHLIFFYSFWVMREEEIILEFLLLFIGFSSVIHVVLDLFSLIFLRFIILISMVVIFYRWFYMVGDINVLRFIIMVLLFVGSIVLLVISPSMLGMIFGWDGLGVSSFLLVIYYNNVSSLRSGLVTIYRNRVGDIFLILRLFFLFSLGWFIEDIFISLISLFFFIFIILAGITKRAQIPFSAWLPAAMSAPTPVSSLVHSSTLVTAGVYLFIRFFRLIRFISLSFWFSVLCLLTSFSAGVIAFIERDLKKIVAISTLRQLGILILCLSVGHLIYSFFHIISHALFKSLLFLCSGFMILIGLGNQDLRFIGNKFSIRKNVFLIFFISVLSLCGFPFLAGFFSRDLIIELFFLRRVPFRLIIFFLFSCFLSLLYRMKILKLGFLSFQMRFFSVFRFFNFIKNFFLFLLCFWSIYMGVFFIFLIVDGELYISFFFQKFLGFFFFFLFFTYFFNKIFQLSFNLVFFINFLSSLLNINWFFGGFFTGKLVFFNFFLLGEIFWLEVLGSKGLFLRFNFLISVLFYNFKGFIISLTFFLFVFFMVFLLPFSLFKSVVLKIQRTTVKQNFFFLFCFTLAHFNAF